MATSTAQVPPQLSLLGLAGFTSTFSTPVNFEPQGGTGGLLGTPGLQLSGIASSFGLLILGLRGVLGDSWGLLVSSCRVLCVLFVC